jgi:hypothetical protein
VERSPEPRFVLFETSGTIELLQGPLIVRYPFITIAGQTAPSPGILIRGPGVIVNTHDVVIQHVRIRVGNLPNEPLALALADDANNVVIDHVSLSWSVWTALGVGAFTAGRPPGEVTITDSIIAESLACSGVNSRAYCDPPTYPRTGSSNSRAMLIGDGWDHPAPKVTVLRTISASSNDRHPQVSGRTETVLVNNLIYNPSLTPYSSIYYENHYGLGPSLSVAYGNLLIAGPTTPGHNGYVPPEYREYGAATMVRIDPTLDPGSRIYLEGNYFEALCGGDSCLASPAAQWSLAKDYKLEWERVNIRASAPPLTISNLPLSSALPYTQVESFLKFNAGARPLDRDAVDARIIREITLRTGRVPNSPSETAGLGTAADGFPILRVNRRALTIPANPHVIVDTVGRTRIEAWLEAFARQLEPATTGSVRRAPL